MRIHGALERVPFPAEDVVAVLREAGADMRQHNRCVRVRKVCKNEEKGDLDGRKEKSNVPIPITPHERLTPILRPKVLVIENPRLVTH
jgi:hypothetical protein